MTDNSQSIRPRDGAAADSDIESGEERDEETLDPDQSGVSPPTNNPFDLTALEKRRRGNVWKNVVIEEDLSSSLSKVSTDGVDNAGKSRFVDLDNPSTSSDAFPSPHPQGRPGITRGRGGKRGGRAPHAPRIPVASSSGDGMDISNLTGFTGPRIGEKRKNVIRPKPKRTSFSKKPSDNLEEKKTYFSVYPNLTEAIEDADRLDIACRKAVAQLNEKWNPYLITKIVTHLGNAEARKLLQLTKTIENSGGMLTKEGKARRSPGGVFIQLFKADAEPKIGVDEVKKILAPLPGSNYEAQKTAKKKRCVARRAERRAAAAASGAATMDTTDAAAVPDGGVEPESTNLSDAAATVTAGSVSGQSMEVDASPNNASEIPAQ